ncbi:MAG: hypothetical protein ACPHIA_02660 [Alphaproteobacteria bacterium]
MRIRPIASTSFSAVLSLWVATVGELLHKPDDTAKPFGIYALPGGKPLGNRAQRADDFFDEFVFMVENGDRVLCIGHGAFLLAPF